MKQSDLRGLAVDELVKHFATLALKQDNALLVEDQHELNRLFWLLEAVEQELKDRDGDQRVALTELYEHPNAQVRVKAAKATLAVAPQSARRMLQRIVDLREFPQAGEAGMSLWNLDRGIYKPT